MRRLVVPVVTVTLAASAVVGTLATTGDETAPARVVVAVPDSPANPYHEIWHGQPSVVTPEILEEFGVDEDHVIHLTRTGDDEFDPLADRDQFELVERGELYWFADTNLFGISFDRGTDLPLLADSNDTSHGAGTTSSVALANPEAIVISVEGISEQSEEWAFTTPFVDIVTTSYGVPGSVPIPGHLEGSYEGVVDLGKIHVGAADNSPALSPFDATSGPWWAIGVAGLHEDDGRGREGLSGNMIDVVSDFTRSLPYCSTCQEGTQQVSGTSFATPRTAGTISKILLEARRDAGHVGGIVTEGVDQPLMVSAGGRSLTNWELRRALEEAAWYPESGQDSMAGPPTSYGVPTEAPWTVIGWGLVTPDPIFDVVFQTLAHLDVIDDDPTRFKSDDACAYMTGTMEARYLYWDVVNVGSDSSSGDHPYIEC